MKKIILAVIMIFVMGVSLNAFANDIYPDVNYDNYTGKLKVTGKAESGSLVTFEILSLGSDYEDLKSIDCADAIFYCGQTMADKDGYFFEIDVEGESGIYKALVVDSARKRYEFDIQIVVPEEYIEAVDKLNSAAQTGYEEFKKVLAENEFKLGFTFDVFASENALENYYEYVKENKLASAEAEKNSKIYKSFVVMDAASCGDVENIMTYIDGIYFENSELKQELIYTAGLNSKAGEYMTEKLENISADTLGDFSEALENVYILGTVMYSSGYGDIVDAFEKYGDNVGIKGNISSKVCQKMRGKDYDADNIGDAYENLADSNSGGGSGGGSSANRNPVSSGGPSMITGSGTPDVKVETTEKMIFTDLSENHWAAAAVEWLKDREIVSGTDTGAFEPERAVTREEFTKMILLACGFEPEDGSAEFADVEDGAWYDKYVYTAEIKGIVNGVGENLFGTGRNIIRQDMSVMVNRATKICNAKLNKAKEYKTFADESDISDYAIDSVKYLYECGVINGKGENGFDPMGNATRAEVAKIIYEAFKGGIAE